MEAVCDLTGLGRVWEEPERTAWRRATAAALVQVDQSFGAPAEGDPMLREQLAELVGVPLQRIVVTSGVRSCAGALLGGVDEVLVERPTFRGVLHALRRARVRFRTGSWVQLADADGAVWFTSPCRNPDGCRADERLVAEVGAAAERGCRVVCNTTYRWFAPMPVLPEAVLQTGTMHKLAGRGARLGWVVTGPDDDEMLYGLAAGAPPLHWQRTWAHFLAGGGADLLLWHHQHLDEARAAFLSALGAADVAGPEGPNLLIPVPVAESEAVARLATAGIRVSPGGAFDAWQPSVRVCLTHISPAVAASAGARLAEVLASAGRTDGIRSPAGADLAV